MDEDLIGQAHAADLRAYLNEDQGDAVTRAHWTEVWWDLLEADSELDGAEARLPVIADQLIHLAQCGRLKTFARPHGGGDIAPLPPALWEIDHDICLARLATCGINLEAPLSREAAPTHWIFVDEADLDREMLEYEEQQALRTDKPKEPLQLLAEGTHNDCAAWLMLQFESPTCPFNTKEEFFEEAQKKFGRSLSERGFLRSWTAATADYPERRRSGPRRKRVNSTR